MNFKPLAPLLLSLALRGTAGAAAPVLPLYFPTTNVHAVPVVLPGVTLEIIPLTMPGAPSHADIEFPAPSIKPLPLRLPTPNPVPMNVAVAARPRIVVEAVAAVPSQEKTSDRALNELRDAAAGRPSIRVAEAHALFDGRRESAGPTIPAGRL